MQLAYATAQDRLLTSHNVRDFRYLHQRSDEHTGILLVPTSERTLLALRIAICIDLIVV
jgi:hypothetical protein